MTRGTRSGVFLGLVSALLVLGLPEGGAAQDPGDPVSVQLDPGSGSVTLIMGDLLSDSRLVSALESGLPLRVRIQVELWRDEFFDDQQGSFEWRMNFVKDPLGDGLRVLGPGPPERDVILSSLEEAQSGLETSIPIPLRPTRGGRYYYLGWVEVETLSLSDIEELQRWLGGELEPAVSGSEQVRDAFESGMGRLLVRTLGLPTRRIRIRSQTFTIDGG